MGLWRQQSKKSASRSISGQGTQLIRVVLPIDIPGNTIFFINFYKTKFEVKPYL